MRRRWEALLAVCLAIIALAAAVGAKLASDGDSLAAGPATAVAFWPVVLVAFANLLELASMLALAALALRAAVAREERRGWLVVGVAALAVRAGLAVGLHLYGLSIGPRALVLDDESAFDLAARHLVAVVAQPGTEFPSEYRHLEGHTLSLLAAVYGALGPHPLLARLANAALGALAAVLAGLAARTLFGRKAGLATGVLVALMPSLVAWSATLLKEALVMAMVALVLWAVARWRVAPSWRLAALALAGVHVLAQVRVYAGLGLGLLAAGALLVWLARSIRRLDGGVPAWAALAVSLLGGVVLTMQLGPLVVKSLDPARLLYHQVAMRLSPPPHERLGQLPPDGSLVGVGVGGPIVLLDSGVGGAEGPGMIIARRGPPGRDGAPPVLAESTALYVATSREQVVIVTPDQALPIMEVERLTALRYVAEGLAHGTGVVLLAPIGTTITGPVLAALGLDAVLWLGVLGLAVGCAVRGRAGAQALVPLGFAVAMLGVLAVLNGDPGNVVRQRAVLTFLPLAIVASASVGRRGQRGEERAVVGGASGGASGQPIRAAD